MTENNNKWRLTADVYAVLNNCKKHIYLAATEKKSYLDPVKKTADIMEDMDCQVVRLELNEFNIKITYPEDMYDGPCCVFIKSSILPENDWYKLKNYDVSTLIDVFTSVKNNCGDFGEETFEAVFQLDNSLVSFTNASMRGYQECVEEFKRRINCELNPKTKKLIPGHRYDTPEETRIFLCSIKTRKVKENNSEFTKLESDCQSGYLYINATPEGIHTVSEALKQGVLESSIESMEKVTTKPVIKVSRSMGAMSEGGEVLIDDYTGEISDYWEEMVHNSLSLVESNVNVDTSNIAISSSLNTMSLFSSKNNEHTQLLMKEIVDCIITQTLGIYWDRLGTSSYSIGYTMSEDENINNCRTLMDSVIKDTNINKLAYYKDMFKHYQLDVKESIKEKIKTWSEETKTFTTDFKKFVKNEDYFYLRQSEIDWTFRQRVNSTNYKLDVRTLASKLGESSELKDTIIALANYAKTSTGRGVKEYFTYNVGTKKDPKIYIKQTITLKDIINFKKGIENMSESLKDEIMSKGFISCFLEYDLNGVLE